jgi:hypothetical protein
MDNEKIHVNILSLKGEKLQSFQIAPSETIYKLHLQIYELLGFDLHEEENNPELFWKKPRVPLVCLSQFLHSMVKWRFTMKLFQLLPQQKTLNLFCVVC